ncbi:hypothetical protein [Flaviflagellibacter deserti]|uniref:PE-PGRS family protein n=1 Tax=Flaviflagellibacter deserti TaxID=2267266 RepID=A0ABV9Z7K8_9HYPH
MTNKIFATTFAAAMLLGSAAFAQTNNQNIDPANPRANIPETDCPAGTNCRNASPEMKGSSDAPGEQGRSSTTGTPGTGTGTGAGAGAGGGAGAGAGGGAGGSGGAGGGNN